ncbi:30S ribosomal protein S15 [bacterium]|nr:30S ribosomal protein S15 [bacterium]MBU1063711.1 30S ribosomal protein S15 [bacterium]MBU1634393.1 30S ribosomal protein S15 [bacterium]MBU1874324.1 30S ribosomal protein S15 [bacterium]
MSLAKEIKQELIGKFGKNALDSGSTEAQIALLTERIKSLNEHFLENPKDHSSRRGLLKLVSRRKHLLAYLSKNDGDAYKKLIGELKLRK